MGTPLDEEPGRSFEALDEEECFSLLHSGSMGRVAVSLGEIPAVFPVNYHAFNGDIYFFTAEGTKLDAAIRRAMVAFQLDHFDLAYHHGWSILAVGKATEIHEDLDPRACSPFPPPALGTRFPEPPRTDPAGLRLWKAHHLRQGRARHLVGRDGFFESDELQRHLDRPSRQNHNLRECRLFRRQRRSNTWSMLTRGSCRALWPSIPPVVLFVSQAVLDSDCKEPVLFRL